MGEHISVLLEEAIQSLSIKKDGIYVDLTLGRAGHSKAILDQLDSGSLLCFDLDPTALVEGGKILEATGKHYTLIHSSFASLKDELAKRGISKVDGILADLGVSSPQFDDPSRGFSYRFDSRLDMRMDTTNPFSAYEVVNTYPEKDLVRILYLYGEEKDAKGIARNIVRARQGSPIETTGQLVDLIKAAKSPKELAKKGHPAKQTFQALRIEVNHETEALEKMLEDAPELLAPGGVLSIITFMSLDDRLVKQRFKELTTIESSRHGIQLRPEEIPVPEFHLYSSKPILPSEAELQGNRRSASAKLRALIRNG